MGQTLETLASIASWADEEQPATAARNKTTYLPELGQRIHMTGWGEIKDLELVWTKHGEQMEDLRDVAILPDESVVVTNYTTMSANRFDRDGGEVTNYYGNKQRPLAPSGVACSHNGTVLILCNNKYVKGLREFNIDKPYQQFRSHGKLFENATMVAVVPSSGLWVVVEAGDEHCINILRDNGTRVRHFGVKYLKHPAGVGVDGMDRIYVTDMKQHEVVVFTVDGDFLFRFGSHGDGMNQFDSPQGICIDPQNNLYIADMFNDRVSVYTPDGRLKFHLNFPAEKQIKQPRGLALDPFSGRLAVTTLDMKRSSLELFVFCDVSNVRNKPLLCR